MIRRPPKSTRTDTLFPYTTLFRSRGPSSVLYGQATNGGIINSVSKTPQFTPEGYVRLEYGSYDRKQAAVDLTGPLNGSGTLAGRIVGVVRDSDQQTDSLKDDRVLISPSPTWRPGADTPLSLIGLYQRDTSAPCQQFLLRRSPTLPP